MDDKTSQLTRQGKHRQQMLPWRVRPSSVLHPWQFSYSAHWRFHAGAAGGTGPQIVTDLIFSRPQSEGWPHHGRTFYIYPCPLSFWLTLPRRVLSTSWCCPPRPCVVFLAYVHLALFFALSLSPGNSLVSSWCDHSMLASLLWRCLTVPSLL